MFKCKLLVVLTLFVTLGVANELTQEQQRIVQEKLLHEFAQSIWTRAMEAKQAVNNSSMITREDPLGNFATSAPRSEFFVNADISAALQSGAQSATVYVSTDNQSSWYSASASLLGTPGYESTWEGIISNPGGTSAYSYLSGLVDSEALGESYGTIIVSGSPHNVNGNWPPASSLYANFVDEPSGDASNSQDIISLGATYKGSTAINSEGEEYTDVERFYVNLGLSGGCCDEGGLFGPWYLYGVGIVNPSAEESIAYAVGYGNGGFGQLSPGLLKITGDLSTGEIGGFEYITENISYNTSGNNLQATALMSYLTNDAQFGVWPNEYNGVILLGVTVEASLSGLDVDAEVKDETNPGLMIFQTTYQDGNVAPVLSDPNYDSETMELSVTYTDADGNLPWWKNAQVCFPSDHPETPDLCFLNLSLIPDSHVYDEGVRFSGSLAEADIAAGDYVAKFWFSDDAPGTPQLTIPVTIGNGCGLLGDSNGDGSLNVLDVVLLVNIVLAGDFNDCADLNGDGSLNVLDIVLLVNVILAG